MRSIVIILVLLLFVAVAVAQEKTFQEGTGGRANFGASVINQIFVHQ